MVDRARAQVAKKDRDGPRYHVRTGCGTCKVRHVKCDEAKPACDNCNKTGRVCDGYRTDKSKDKTAAVPSLLYSKIYNQALAAPTQSQFAFLKSTEERRCYEFFQCRTRQEINFTFGSATRAHQLILQASHSSTSIKHTVIALGSLTEYLSDVRLASHNVTPEKGRLQYADTQYIRAISQLQKDMSTTKSPPPEIILTACVLLSLFDFLRGEQASAGTHLAAGISILRRCYPTELLALTNTTSNSYNDRQQQSNTLVRDFARIFSTMDMHAAIWLGLSTFSSPPLLQHDYLAYPISPDVVPTLDDVSTNLNSQSVRVHCFHHAKSPRNEFISSEEEDLVSHIPFHILAEKELLLYELEQWPSTLTRCLAALPTLTPHQSHRVALMRMNYHALLITLSTFFLPSSPILYDSFTPTFAQILADATFVLSAGDEPNASTSTPSSNVITFPSCKALLYAVAANSAEPDPFNISIFAFVAGACQPLYLVATKSPDMGMRWEAVEMLEGRHSSPWREGAWDSKTMGRFARTVLEGGQQLRRS